MQAAERPEYVPIEKSARRFGAWCITAIVVHLVYAFVLVVTDFGKGQTVSLMAVSVRAMSFLFLAVQSFIALGVNICFCLWVHRAFSNLPALGIKDAGSSKAVLISLFIPIYNVIRPYFYFKELWQATSPQVTEGWRRLKVPRELFLCWLLLQIYRPIGAALDALFGLSFGFRGPGAISEVLYAVLLMFGLYLVQQMSSRMHQKAHLLGLPRENPESAFPHVRPVVTSRAENAEANEQIDDQCKREDEPGETIELGSPVKQTQEN